MTRTETSSPSASLDQQAPVPSGWVSTADHKRLGTLFLVGAFAFLIVGGVVGGVLRAELLSEGAQVDLAYGRVFSLHATVSALLFLGPAWVGVATWVVPLQIGATRLAFPRLHAFALWLFLLGGALLLAAHAVGTPLADLSASTPEASPEGGAGTATDVAVMGMVLVAASMILASMSLAVTVLKLRTVGLTLRRAPLFTWAVLITSLATLLSTPVFLAGLVLLWLDRHFGGQLLAAGAAAKGVWRHTLWLFGRPEAYLALLPGLGAACDIVATHARRRLFGSDTARGAMVAFAALAFTAWAAGGEVIDALVLPTYTPLTALVALPVAVVALVWLRTAVQSRPRPHVSVLFVAAFLALAGAGAVHVLAAALAEVRGQAWTTGHLHTVAFGAPTMLLFAAVYHWAPKILGCHLSPKLGAACFLALFGGFFLLGLGSYLLGYDGAPAHVRDYPVTASGPTFSAVAAVGTALVLLGALAFVLDVAKAALFRRGEEAGADPYEGLTLEWATPSPPPPQNFEQLPEVRSDQPLLDLRTAAGSGRRG